MDVELDDVDTETTAKQILNMKKYTFHSFMTNDMSLLDVGKEKLTNTLEIKRELKRHNAQLLKDTVLGLHKATLTQSEKIKRRLIECKANMGNSDNGDGSNDLPPWGYHAINDM